MCISWRGELTSTSWEFNGLRAKTSNKEENLLTFCILKYEIDQNCENLKLELHHKDGKFWT